ncbi:MAG: haloacid dehalogenase type II [Casimicrobiaceae bacterium]
MPGKPDVIVFDVIETLFSLDPIETRLRAAGMPAGSLRAVFAALLRDAFALDAAGTPKPFAEIARATLEVALTTQGIAGADEKIESIMAGFAELPAHDDVRPAFEAVRDAGIRIITLTNGSAENTRKLLARAGLAEFVEKSVAVAEANHWKPRAEVYRHAATTCGMEPGRMAMVAAHAWDLHGAKQVGFMTGWVQRQDKQYLGVMAPPDVTARSLPEVVHQLLGQAP